MDIYRESLLDHYQNPRNFGPLEHADAEMEMENLSCGDRIKILLKFEGDKIASARFEGEGCAIAIASASIMTEWLAGKPKSAALNFKLDNLMELLGVELTVSRSKCAALSTEALQKALAQAKK